MDEIVTRAMKKWPNVPSATGWLSLNALGQWRFHPNGDYQANPEGEAIENPQICSFINRNYHVDGQGRWFFQNGPQRVFMMLPFAPLILWRAEDPQNLQAHTGQIVGRIFAWHISEQAIYAQTDLGPGMVEGRTALNLLEHCEILDNQSEAAWAPPSDDQLEALLGGETQAALSMRAYGRDAYAAPLSALPAEQLESVLGFTRYPEGS